MHPTEGQIRAYADHELPELERPHMQAHLDACSACRALAEVQRIRASQAKSALLALDPTPAEAATPARQAYRKFETFSSRKDKTLMFQKLFSPRLRIAWVAVTLIVVVALFATLPPLKAIASDFLGLFRVQQVSVVEIDPLNLPANFEFDEASITQMVSENVKFETIGEEQQAADALEASSVAGIPVRLPTSFTSTPRFTIQPGIKMDFKVDLDRIQDLLKEAGFTDIEIPAELDGENVKAELPRIVTATYGEPTGTVPESAVPSNQKDPDATGEYCIDCTVLVQLASPKVETPKGVDLTAIGKAYLRLTGMTAEDADAFSQAVDWSTTLVVPVPNFTSHQVVAVDGVSGILIQQNPEYDTQYMLIWAKDGLVYALTGYGSAADALGIANSIK